MDLTTLLTSEHHKNCIKIDFLIIHHPFRGTEKVLSASRYNSCTKLQSYDRLLRKCGNPEPVALQGCSSQSWPSKNIFNNLDLQLFSYL